MSDKSNGEIERKLSPEEEECEAKQRELNAQEAILADLQLEYATLAAQLRDFHLEFICIVGIKYAELDELLYEIAMLQASEAPEGTEESEEAETKAEAAREKAEQSREEADQGVEEEKEREKFEPTEELKKLYKEAVLKYHPDKAPEEDKERCTKIFVELQAAYEAGDIDRIKEILAGEHGVKDEKPGESIAERLIRLIQSLAQIKLVVINVQQDIENLKQDELWSLREKVSESRENGEDLLEEMAEKVQVEIDAAREKLRRVQGGEEEE